MTPEEQIDKGFKEILNNQLKFERETDRKMQGFMQTISETVAASPVLAEQEGPDVRQFRNIIQVLGEPDQSDDITAPKPPLQLPLSFRYRNDIETGGAEEIQRLEYIFKPSPYSDDAHTTFWPDADWTAIPGADAETYEP